MKTIDFADGNPHRCVVVKIEGLSEFFVGWYVIRDAGTMPELVETAGTYSPWVGGVQVLMVDDVFVDE